MIKEIYVESIGEYMDCVSNIVDESGKFSETPEILWFRGVSHVNHSLVPSLFRTNVRAENGFDEYSELHYAEDIRTQHYIARNFHFFSNVPQSRVEWLEVMQHHGAKTRVLDWSESSIHSLVFALEMFLDNLKFSEEKRRESVPCVWVLKPQELNRQIICNLSKNKELIRNLTDELGFTDDEFDSFWENLKKFGDDALNTTKDTKHMDYVLNLSTINDEMLRERIRLKHLLLTGGIVNAVHYLLARIYSDGYILSDRTLPPLAVVHPYHSERIKAQKGVFTVYPYYQENEKDGKIRKLGVNPDALENNLMAKSCLCKIVLHRPQKIARQILLNGINGSWLYPEMPIISSEIENHKVY